MAKDIRELTFLLKEEGISLDTALLVVKLLSEEKYWNMMRFIVDCRNQKKKIYDRLITMRLINILKNCGILSEN